MDDETHRLTSVLVGPNTVVLVRVIHTGEFFSVVSLFLAQFLYLPDVFQFNRRVFSRSFQFNRLDFFASSREFHDS